MAPDEGNMFLLGKVATAAQKARARTAGARRGTLGVLHDRTGGRGRGGIGPLDAEHHGGTRRQRLGTNGRKKFITGAEGCPGGIVMARTGDGDARSHHVSGRPSTSRHPHRARDRHDRQFDAGGHAQVLIDGLRLPADQVLGEVNEGFRYAQGWLSPARLSHCMRWFGTVTRADEIARAYATTRKAFGKLPIDHEGVGFMLAENLIDLAGGADDRLVRGRARHRLGGHDGKLDGEGGRPPRRCSVWRTAACRFWAAMAFRATPSSTRPSASCVRSGSTTARPKSTSGRWRRRSSATRCSPRTMPERMGDAMAAR
jgi:alkylation response protein AidB-like acyl-CoA dehydrogenase